MTAIGVAEPAGPAANGTRAGEDRQMADTADMTAPGALERGKRKVRVGRVVSDRMDKTVVVAVEWRRTHPIYGKSVGRVTKFKAHDEAKGCRVGDVVRIVETRPLSKTKRWRVTEVVQRGEAPEVRPVEIGAPAMEVPAAAPAG